MEAEFAGIYRSMRGGPINRSTALYVLLQRASVLTRVVAKTDDVILNHCNAPIVIDTATNPNDAFTLQVMQGAQMKYSGPLQTVQLTDVAALTLSIVSRSPMYAYAFDNISVVYSLVDAAQITPPMPGGRTPPQPAALCQTGGPCPI